jgi:hypothetical protein
MWEQYKKTFIGMQATIVLMVLVALFATRSVKMAAGVLVTTEAFSAYGAMWGARVRRLARSSRRGVKTV